MADMTTPEKMHGNLAAALVALQGELPRIEKAQTADTGSYSYDYADLTAITNVLMPLLSQHGLAFTATPTLKEDDGQFVLAYSLLHESGERLIGWYPLPLQGTPQAIGSAITYGRRYCLCAVTGVAPGGSDDDGAAAQVGFGRGHDPYAEHRSPVDAEAAREAEGLKTAKHYVMGAWKLSHDGQFDVAAMTADYEQHAAKPLADATADDLNAYADQLAAARKAEAAAETGPEEAKPDV